MAELSALNDKFDTWTIEEPKPSRKPPMGGRPPAGARLGIPGSALVKSNKQKQVGARQASQGPPGACDSEDESIGP